MVRFVPNSEMTGYHFAFSTRYAAERSFPTVSGRPNCSQTSRSAAAPDQALTHYQRAEPARHVGIHCGDAFQEHRPVFIDPARLIGIVLFCADARSAAPITAFEISH
jgi:hypothetical protein